MNVIEMRIVGPFTLDVVHFEFDIGWYPDVEMSRMPSPGQPYDDAYIDG